MLRIAQMIETMDVRAGGTSTAFLNIFESLLTASDRLAPHAFTMHPPGDDPAMHAVRGAPSAWSLSSGLGRYVFVGALGRDVARAARNRSFDLLHIHGLWSPDLLAAARACRRAGIPYVWEPHGMLIREAFAQKRWKKELFMAIGMRRALQRAAGLVFVTAEERDHSLIPAGVGPERLHVVPLPVITPTLTIDEAFRAAARAKFGIPPGAPCVVFMGRLHPVKRVEMAIDALATLGKDSVRLGDTRLLLIGGGDAAYESELKARAQRAGVGDRVIFGGWVKGDDKWRALGAGDILTLNSVHENFGFVAVEALCVGTFPVLTSNLAIASELVQGGVGASCAPTSADMAAAWAEALGARAKGWANVHASGRRWVDAHLSTVAIGRTLADLYQRVLSAKRPPDRG